MTGDHFFDLSDWETGTNSGESWEHWSVNNGVFTSVAGIPIDCTLSTTNFNSSTLQVVPNPFSASFSINGITSAKISLFDMQGRLVLQTKIENKEIIETNQLQSGMYTIQIVEENKIQTKKLIKK